MNHLEGKETSFLLLGSYVLSFPTLHFSADVAFEQALDALIVALPVHNLPNTSLSNQIAKPIGEL